MVVDSGGGIHAYWPLQHAVTTEQWKPVAERFKAICEYENFKSDRSVTADTARVLRCLGGFNVRRGMPTKLLYAVAQPTTFQFMENCFDKFIESNNVPIVLKPAVHLYPSIPMGTGDNLDDNLGASNEPLHFDQVAFACGQIGAQAAVRGAGVGEKLWRAGLGIVKFCEPLAPAYRAISDGHAEYSEAATVIKIHNWRAGPTACTHFHDENPATCEACPHWQNITSPAQLGRLIPEAKPSVVAIVDPDGEVIELDIPPPPSRYQRSPVRGVTIGTETKDGTPKDDLVCPYDLYPIKIMRQNGDDVDERSVWRVHLARINPFDMDIQQSLLSDAKRLHAYMLAKGVYMTSANATATQEYMSAYLQVLAAQADREKLYDHLGWNDDHSAFVLGTKVIRSDGTEHPHNPSRSIKRATKDGVATAGTLAGWKAAAEFFNRPGYEGHRFFMYASLGAPLFHMNDTGNKGVLLTASGDSGRGKTTCLKACASMWGKSEALLTNGNKDGTTVNMLYEKLGIFCNLPFFWDDLTEQEPDALRRFLLNISQGLGKERMHGSDVATMMRHWATIVLGSANTDDISRIMSSGKDVDPHLMRMVGVEFKAIDTSVEAKIEADKFLRDINANYGHVAPIFMSFVVKNYARVAKGYIKNVEMVDRMLNSANASAERYWSATVAAAYTGAQIASALGLITYPYEEDLKWMVGHLTRQRGTIVENKSTADELLSEFLNAHIGNTLVVSAKASSNLDNIIHHPHSHSGLLIRHELDYALIYVSRTAIMDYCVKNKTSFVKMEHALQSSGVIVNHNQQKVLGADTKYTSGQIRSWKIDANRLDPSVLAAATTTVPQTNVTPIRGVRP